MKLDPRRPLIGIAMAGALILTPPVVGIAAGTLNPAGTADVQAYGFQQGPGTSDVMADDNDNWGNDNDDGSNVNDNDDWANENDDWVNDNDDGVDNDNVDASTPAQPTPVPAATDDPYYQYNHDPNNN